MVGINCEALLQNLPNWITAVIAVLGVPAAFYQYWKAQRWKKAEWLAEEMRRVVDDPWVRNALLMLDWRDRTLPLILPGQEGKGSFDYEEKMLLHALSSRTSEQVRDYNDGELSIRDSFDRLLEAFERLDSVVEAGLVTASDLGPYLKYWMDVIGNPENPRKGRPARERLWFYIADYGYVGTQRLFKRFGYDIRPKVQTA